MEGDGRAAFRCPYPDCIFGGSTPRYGFKSPEHLRAHINCTHKEDIAGLGARVERHAAFAQYRLPGDSTIKYERSELEVRADQYPYSAAWFCSHSACCDAFTINGNPCVVPREFHLTDATWYRHNATAHKGVGKNPKCSVKVALAKPMQGICLPRSFRYACRNFMKPEGEVTAENSTGAGSMAFAAHASNKCVFATAGLGQKVGRVATHALLPASAQRGNVVPGALGADIVQQQTQPAPPKFVLTSPLPAVHGHTISMDVAGTPGGNKANGTPEAVPPRQPQRRQRAAAAAANHALEMLSESEDSGDGSVAPGMCLVKRVDTACGQASVIYVKCPNASICHGHGLCTRLQT